MTLTMANKPRRASMFSLCKVCKLPAGERARLEMLFVSGASTPSIAKQFGLTHHTVWRHCNNPLHLSDRRKAELMTGPARVSDLANAAAKESKSLLEYLQIVRSVTFAQFLSCAEVGDVNGVASVGARLIESLKELDKLTGELRQLSGITVNQNILNVVADPAYPDLEAGLLEIVRKFPEARDDVLALLARLESATSPPPGPNGSSFTMIECEAVDAEAVHVGA
jgi:hypothetical protein